MHERTRRIALAAVALSAVALGEAAIADPAPVASTIVVTNAAKRTKDFVLEPWGEIHPIPPGAEFHVIVSGPAGKPEIAEDDASITFWAWSGTTVRVTHDGREVGQASHRPVVPATPAGKSVGDFMKDTGLSEK